MDLTCLRINTRTQSLQASGIHREDIACCRIRIDICWQTTADRVHIDPGLIHLLGKHLIPRPVHGVRITDLHSIIGKILHAQRYPFIHRLECWHWLSGGRGPLSQGSLFCFQLTLCILICQSLDSILPIELLHEITRIRSLRSIHHLGGQDCMTQALVNIGGIHRVQVDKDSRALTLRRIHKPPCSAASAKGGGIGSEISTVQRHDISGSDAWLIG